MSSRSCKRTEGVGAVRSSRRVKTAVYRKADGSIMYPEGSGLLDRKALVQSVRRLERRLMSSTVRLEAESKRALELGEESRVATKLSVRERRSALRLERSTFSSFARILGAVESYNDRDVEKEEALRSLLRAEELKFLATLPESERAKDGDGDAALARAFAEAGQLLADRVEKALAKAKDDHQKVKTLEELLESERLDRKNDLDRDLKVAALQDECRTLQRALKDASDTNFKLQADLQRRTDLSAKRASVLASIDKRDFKQNVLDLLADLSSAVHRRLGFIPASTRNHINNFIHIIADYDDLHFKEQQDDFLQQGGGGSFVDQHEHDSTPTSPCWDPSQAL